MDLKLGENAADMISGSDGADEELLGDGPGRGARGQQAEDFLFATSQVHRR